MNDAERSQYPISGLVVFGWVHSVRLTELIDAMV